MIVDAYSDDRKEGEDNCGLTGSRFVSEDENGARTYMDTNGETFTATINQDIERIGFEVRRGSRVKYEL